MVGQLNTEQPKWSKTDWGKKWNHISFNCMFLIKKAWLIHKDPPLGGKKKKLTTDWDVESS